MITIDDIISNSQEHYLYGNNGGKVTLFTNNKIMVSIVGGSYGLYGDFEDDFEVAIIDKKSGEFVTSFFLPDQKDVVEYMKSDELVDLLNKLFHNGFQVTPY